MSFRRKPRTCSSRVRRLYRRWGWVDVAAKARRADAAAAALCGVSPTGDVWRFTPGSLQLYKDAAVQAVFDGTTTADAPVWAAAFDAELGRRNAGREADIARVAARAGDFTGYRH